MEAEQEFTLILQGVPDLTPEVVNALFDAGCDDATVSRQNGVIAMDFDRPAASLKEAIVSAITDVTRAGIGARVARVEPSPDPSSTAAGRDLGTINSILRISSMIELDPKLHPLAQTLFAHIR
jgi:hypothetical protein